MIVLSSGKNIYPEEIEAVYRKSAFIKELCVLGLARPGEPSAERLYAVVVPDEDVLRERKIANVGDILRFEMEGASVNLPHHKRVLGYEIWLEPLPRTTTGKIKRFEIERRVRRRGAGQAGAGRAHLVGGRPRVSGATRACADPRHDGQGAAPGMVLTPDANLELDLGLDSMERVELLTALEQRFGADIPDGVMQRLYTVRELAESIRQHARAESAAAEGAAWAVAARRRVDRPAEMDRWLEPH